MGHIQLCIIHKFVDHFSVSVFILAYWATLKWHWVKLFIVIINPQRANQALLRMIINFRPFIVLLFLISQANFCTYTKLLALLSMVSFTLRRKANQVLESEIHLKLYICNVFCSRDICDRLCENQAFRAKIEIEIQAPELSHPQKLFLSPIFVFCRISLSDPYSKSMPNFKCQNNLQSGHFNHEPGINSLPRNFYTRMLVMMPIMTPQKIKIQFPQGNLLQSLKVLLLSTLYGNQ